MVDLKTNGFRGDTIIAEHKAIMNAALRHDYKGCAQALGNHISYYLHQLATDKN